MDIRQMLGQGGPLVLGNKTYQVASVTPGISGLFESWLIANARRRAYAGARDLPPDDAERCIEAAERLIGAGEYAFGGRTWLSALRTLEGYGHLLYLRIRACQPEVTKDEVEALVYSHLPEIQKQLASNEADPTGAARTPPKPA